MILDMTSAGLFTTLTGGTALTALLAGTASVYDTQAPDNATLPYVVFSHQGGGPENVDANSLEQNIWYVRAYSATSSKTATEIFAQADALINRINISVSGFNTFWCAREENIKLVETTPSGRIWSAGGLYRIRTA